MKSANTQQGHPNIRLCFTGHFLINSEPATRGQITQEV
jgi:hypothetical protein